MERGTTVHQEAHTLTGTGAISRKNPQPDRIGRQTSQKPGVTTKGVRARWHSIQRKGGPRNKTGRLPFQSQVGIENLKGGLKEVDRGRQTGWWEKKRSGGSMWALQTKKKLETGCSYR